MSLLEPKKPKHLTQHEWDEQLRHTNQQLRYDLYNMTKRQKDFAMYAAGAILVSLVGGICFVIVKILIAFGGLFS